MKEVAAGIDIGGTNTIIGLVDREGHCYGRKSLMTRQYETAESFTRALAHELELLIGSSFQLTGIGIGAPNGNYLQGTIESAVNLPWKEVIPMVSMMKQYFSVPVKLTNDANAAAMGEMIFGAARGMKDFIMITLGTGLGSGIVVDGKLLYGHDGFAGELGHTTVIPGGRECFCGKKGCLETYVSATGITRTMKYLLDTADTESSLRRIPVENIDSLLIYEAALNGDPLAQLAFDETCKILGESLANAVAFSSPQAIILYGGLAKAREFIFGPTKRYMEENLLFIYKNKVTILPSQLPENDAALLGAAALVWG